MKFGKQKKEACRWLPAEYPIPSWMMIISEAHRIQARLRMHMGHMYIFIIIAIANTFTMRPLSLVD